MFFHSKNIITAIEIGTSKICVAIGQADSDNIMHVLGYSEQSLYTPSSNGQSIVCKGEIINVEEVSNVLETAIREAMDNTEEEIDCNNIYLAVTGSHIRSVQGHGITHIQSDTRKITEKDIYNAFQSAINVNISPNYETLNFFESYYRLDDSINIATPQGQIAKKLEAFVHVIYGDYNRIATFKSALHELGYENDAHPVFSGIASAFGVMSSDERQNDALIIDFGAGSTEYILQHDGGFRASGVIPVGTDHLSNDLSIAFSLPIDKCRKIITQSELFNSKTKSNAVLSISGISRKNIREIPIFSIEKVIDLRLFELFKLIHEDLLQKANEKALLSPIIITGGGALIPHTQTVISQIFNAPVSIGIPKGIGGAVTEINTARHSMICGLLIFGEALRELRSQGDNGQHPLTNKLYQLVRRPMRDVKNFIMKVKG